MNKTAATDRSSRRSTRKTRLLVADDQPDQLRLVEEAFRQTFESVELISLSEPQDVMAYLQDCLQTASGFPQLILLDLYMPTRQLGMHLLEQIRSLPEPVEHLPIIMLSSSSDARDIQDAYDQGATSYVIKPSDFQQWLQYFTIVREYWWETVSLPTRRYV